MRIQLASKFGSRMPVSTCSCSTRRRRNLRPAARSLFFWVILFAVSASFLAVLQIPVVSFRLMGLHRIVSERLSTKNTHGIERKVTIEHIGLEEGAPPPVVEKYTYNSKKERYYQSFPEYVNRYRFLPQPNQVSNDQRTCFVHIGKTAGSTLSCLFGFQHPKCKGEMKMLTDSPLLQVTTNIMHVKHDTCQKETIGLYLFAVRDPLARLMSWFTYEIPGHRHSGWREDRRQQKIKPLYVDCGFHTLNQLGEAMIVDSASSDGRQQQQPTECSKVAWEAVTGSHGYAYHNKMNYGYYWNQVPSKQQKNTRIVVIRTEHLEQDWFSAERVVSTSTETATAVRVRSNATASVFGKKNQSVKTANDAQLSDTAQRNICAGLCQEIQIYKMLLRRAENLSPGDFAISMKELQQKCPVQAVAEQCPTSSQQ